jgi:hypothetical protein
MIFFVLLLLLMVIAYIAQYFIGPVPVMGARVLLMQIVMLYGSIALPLPGMIALTFVGGLMWDAGHVLTIGDTPLVSMGWSIALYMALGTVMAGFRPLFVRGRWEIHCLLTGLLVAAMPLAEFIMITIRTEPIQWVWNRDAAWRIGGAGLIATLLSPLVFFVLNYLAVLTGYDPQPERNAKQPKR